MTSGRKIFNMVLALVVAIASWVFVVYNYKPMTQVNYSNIPVTFTGERDLAERGLTVKSTSLETVSVTLNQKRVDGRSITADDISASVDVSNCTAGDNNVALKVNGPTGTSVFSASATMAAVDVARAKTDIKEIDVVYGDGAEEGEEPISYDLSSVSAEVSCSADNLGKIDKVAAVLERKDLTDKVKSFTVYPKALDKSGNVIPHVVITPKEISLDACAGYTKKVNLYVTINNESGDDYNREYTAPETVVIKGSKDALNKVSSIVANDVYIGYMYEDGEVEIEYNLPEGIYIADESRGQVVSVKVTKKDDKEE